MTNDPIGFLDVRIPINDRDVLQRVLTAMGAATPITGPSPVPPPSPPPSPATDANVYPLTMAPVVAPGAPVSLGVGPDVTHLRLNAGIKPGDTCELAVSLNSRVIAAPMTVTGIDGMEKGQVFTLRGAFGPAPHRVRLVGTGNGMSGLWVNAVTVNYEPLYYNGGPLDNRGTQPAPNSERVWDANGLAIEFGPPVDVPVTPPVPVEPPAPVVPQSLIAGAQINGSALPEGTIDEFLALIRAGETLTLPEGTFHATAIVPVPCTIRGAGIGKTILDGAGMRPTRDKACLVPMVPGVTIADMTIQNWHIPAALGGNAAAVRQDGEGIGFTLDGVEITGCDDGVLAFGSAAGVTVVDCLFHGNGAGSSGGGATHEQYFGGGPGSVVNQSGVIAACGPKATHDLKSRASSTTVVLGHYTGNAFDPGGANAGGVMDFPNGGEVMVQGTTITIPAGAGNTVFLSYGVDSLDYETNAVTLSGCVFDDQSGTGGIIYAAKPGITLDVTGSTYTGSVAPELRGWASVVGTLNPTPRTVSTS